MDQGQCLMWASKRKCSNNNNNNNSILGASTKSTYSSNACDEYYSSWEEQAFAKDSAGGASGCIWPPRSYSCSFCRREFRSAQALGGHMNVHRRDRARLKQPSSPQNENHVQNYPFSSLGNYFGFSSNSSNNPSSYDHALDVLPSPSEALPDKNFREEAMMIPLCNSASSVPYSSYSKSKPGSGEDYCRLLYSHELLDPESDAEKKASKGLDYYSSGCIRSDERDIDEKTDDVAVSLNLFVRRTHNHHPSMQFETNEEEADLSLKKRKTEYGSSIIPLSPKSSSDHKHHHVQSSQVFEFSTSFIEELDLELRLGYRSQV